METKVILISGKAQNGKDTSANFFKEILEDQGKSVLIMHYSDLLKFICKEYFGWNGEKDETGRTLLQYVGTDLVRAREPNFWVDHIVHFLKVFNDKWDYVIIPDTRFPNEIRRIREGGISACHVKVTRGSDFDNGLTEKQKNHPSENALKNVSADISIDNTGSMDELKTTIQEAIKNPYFDYKFY